jgi:hypothetical protein
MCAPLCLLGLKFKKSTCQGLKHLGNKIIDSLFKLNFTSLSMLSHHLKLTKQNLGLKLNHLYFTSYSRRLGNEPRSILANLLL